MRILGLHHVQLAMPAGGEDDARAFYGDLLGLGEVVKPEVLAGHGGVWFERGALRVHLGVETPHSAARKAHPAFEVEGLDDLARHLQARGAPVEWDDAIPGQRRFYAADPFGNRIEFLEMADPVG
jgi:catechol 2,3-dioxygenase-like lactoylglutathione lyase family enzyme